jgi:DNA-binding PadR family transcriptional regulator
MSDAHYEDLCKRLQRRVNLYFDSEAGQRELHRERRRPLHIREIEEAILSIRALVKERRERTPSVQSDAANTAENARSGKTAAAGANAGGVR